MSSTGARKRFGQHFLISDSIIEKIVHAISPQEHDVIVEIGPGRGAITRPLIQLASTFHAIEFDRDLVPTLVRQYGDYPNATFHEADALQFDFAGLGDRLRIVGNLPYNISTPLLFRLAEFRDVLVDMHFMLQKEVVDRLAAEPGSKAYGRLTIMLGCHFEVVPLFDVPPEAFLPPPRVMSSVVRLRPLPAPGFDIADPEMLETLVKLAFSRRRKTLRNALKGMASDVEIEAQGLEPSVRPEQVAIADWVGLANTLAINVEDIN